MKTLRCLMRLRYVALLHQDARSEGDVANGAPAPSLSQTNASVHMNACGDDVHDRAPVRQGQVSVSPFTPSEVACEPFASQLCLLSALTHGRFASSLCFLSFVFVFVFCLLSFVFVFRLSSFVFRLSSFVFSSFVFSSFVFRLSSFVFVFVFLFVFVYRDTRAHSSTSSTVSSGQLPPTPRVLRQSDILNTLNSAHAEAEDRCFRVSVARRLMLPHPAAANAADVVQFCPNKSERRPSLSGTPTVTFCSVHIHNVVAKKRDASTELLQRLHGYMKQQNVDFIGGDFNMSALSTIGDVFSGPEFSAPGNSFLWGLGALEEQNRECIGFLIMPKRPFEWRVDSHGCYKFDNAALGFGPRDQTAHLPVFLHLRTTHLPGPDSIMRGEHAQQRRMERRHHKHDRTRRRRT